NTGLYSTSRLVLAARARGHQVDVVDPLDLMLVVHRGSPSVAYAAAPLPRYRALIPRIGARATRYGSQIVARMQTSTRAVLNDAASIELSRDKVTSLQRLAERRIAVPTTLALHAVVGLDAALPLLGGPPVVIKLQRGTHGIGIMLAESRGALVAMVETFLAMGHEVILQQYVPSPNGDLRAVVVGGKLVAAMRRRGRAGDFRSNLHGGGEGEGVDLPRRYRSTAERAAKVLGLEVAGVDILETKDGPVVIEVNSSPGLEGIELASKVDVADAIVAHAEHLARRKNAASRGKRKR
ncbi:MAG: RimK family alpha-L-glutamate ligase, partial [Myxococcales bacterium]|nr:RimK family alpha-L-glutamate ligase [Myxococcales bacterium]